MKCGDTQIRSCQGFIWGRSLGVGHTDGSDRSSFLKRKYAYL